MNFKQKILLFLCKTFYRPYSYKVISNAEKYNIDQDNFELIKKTTFNLYRIKINKKTYYFREARKHTIFKDYLLSILEDYFEFANINSNFKNCKKMIIDKLSEKKVMKALYNIGIVNDKKSKIYRFFNTNDYSIFFIDELKKIDIKDIKDLFQYLWGEIYQYRLNNGVKKDYYQTFNISKTIGTYTLACMLDLNQLIPKTFFAEIVINGKIKYGSLMEEAPGISPCELMPVTQDMISVNFYNQCCSLYFLDTLIYEKDHRPGNYNVICHNNIISSLKVFDNDSPLAFFITPSIKFSSYMKSSPIVDKNNILILNHMSYSPVNKVLDLKSNDIKKKLKNVLSPIQIFFLNIRIKKIQRVIIKTIKTKKDFLLKNNQWSCEDIKNDVNSNYNTYLNILLSNNYVENNYE